MGRKSCIRGMRTTVEIIPGFVASGGLRERILEAESISFTYPDRRRRGIQKHRPEN